jgi:hypothetical protein
LGKSACTEMDDFERLFLNEDALRVFFVYLCHLNKHMSDPITESLVVLLSGKTQFSIGKHGIVILQGTPSLPFMHMDAAQRQLVYEVVSSIRCEWHTYPPFCKYEDPLTYSVENEIITLNHTPKKIDQRVVFQVLLQCIVDSKHPSILLFNLIMQRIGCRISVPRETIMFINEKTQILRKCSL